MPLPHPLLRAAVFSGLAAASAGFAQPPAQLEVAAPLPATAPAATPAIAPKTYTVPAGTKFLLQLRSSINTKSAKPGDGVYLASTFPVVVGNRVMIPVGVYVQGVVDRVERAGHVKGKDKRCSPLDVASPMQMSPSVSEVRHCPHKPIVPQPS